MARLVSRKETNKRKTLFRDEAMEAAAALPSDDITFEQAWIIHKLDCLGCLLHDVHNPNFLSFTLLRSLFARNFFGFCIHSIFEVWYNDPVFRQIIFDWRPSQNYVRPAPPAMDVEAVMNSLQHLFYTMQTTPFEDTDDNRHFTGALRLGNEQQDAQEFSLVLFDALDRNLPKHPHGEDIRQRIRERYSGSTTQRIWCTCGRESSRSSPFTALQLNIDGFKTLQEVLDAYFGEELLEDYLCDECGRRGHVKRQTLPEKLPPVVMLQLNRYVFDVNGRNRKLKTPIIYPRELSARSFHLNVSKYDDFDYELFAVMIHEGDNTYCGHYYDLVRHPFTGIWYKYNDEHVEPLARPPGVDRSKTIPGGRPTPDMKACYGLAYRRKEPAIPEIIMPPDDITETWIVATEHRFDGQTKETIAKSEKRLNDLTLRYSQLSALFEALETNADRYKTPKDVAFLPTKMLSDILEKEYVSMAAVDEKNEEPSAESPMGQNSMSEEPTVILPSKRAMRTSRLRTVRHKIAGQLAPQEMPVCHHGRLFVDSVLFGDVKAVSRVTAESLLSQYGITTKIKYDSDASENSHPLLTGCDICVDCVKELRREGQFRDSLEGHVKLANRIFKDKSRKPFAYCQLLDRCSLSRVPKPEGYLYISKKCLANFKKLALREMEHQHRLQSAGATLQFVVNLAAVDAKYSASASSPRRGRGARRKRLMAKSEDGSPSCNGCDRPLKHAKDDDSTVTSNCDEQTPPGSVEVKEENEAESGLTSVDGTSYSAVEEETKCAAVDCTTQVSTETDVNSSSVSSVESGSQPMELDQFESEASVALLNACQEIADSEQVVDERPRPVENGSGRLEESEVEKTAQEQCEGQSTDSSPPERPSSSPLERPSSSASRSSTHETGAVEFNSELRCEHGGINLDEFRQAVSPEEWKQLSSYFDPTTTFVVRCDEPICQQCEQEFNEQQWGKQELKESNKGSSRAYWARTSSLVLPSICQDCVMCTHGLPNVGLACDIANVHIVGLTEQEWTKLCEEISAGLGTTNGAEPPRPNHDFGKSRRIENMCEGCFGERLEALNIQRYVYDDAFIYVALSEDGAISAPLSKTTRRTQKNKCFRVKMSSTDTIKDLKIQLYKQTGQTPNDQLLYRELGGSLLDGDSTLFEARIEKNNADQPLILIAQSMSAVSAKYDEQQPRAPERGFIDTALAH
ncbi:ubiquitinyl hydrolase 1 [Cooperia oncophora]